jgi:transposase
MTLPERFGGVDVSKAVLDAHVRPDGAARRFDNTPEGIDALPDWLRPLAVTLVVVEASGGYERAVLTALALGGLPVSLVNPQRARDCARALGTLAKTDAIDGRFWPRSPRRCARRPGRCPGPTPGNCRRC